MIRGHARPNALSRASMEEARVLLPDVTPLIRNFVVIDNNWFDNTITINSKLGNDFPKIVKTPYLTKHDEVITTDTFNNKEGEVVHLIRV